MLLKRYDAGPRPSQKNPTGGLRGRSPPSGFGFRDPARRPGAAPPALPGITRPGSKKGYGFGFGIGFWVWVIFPGFWRMLQTQISNISRILENVADSDFQYFQDPRTPEKSDFQYFQASNKFKKCAGGAPNICLTSYLLIPSSVIFNYLVHEVCNILQNPGNLGNHQFFQVSPILEMRAAGGRLLWSGFPGLDYFRIDPGIL